jgi:HEAT repeat protein
MAKHSCGGTRFWGGCDERSRRLHVSLDDPRSLLADLWREATPHARVAAEALAARGDLRAMTFLLAAMKGPDELDQWREQNIRRKKAGPARGTDLPLAAQQDPDRTLAGAACEALVRVGPRAIPSLVDLLAHPDVITRRCAVEALDGLGWTPASARDRIAAALARPDWELVTAQGSPAVRPLIRLLADRSSEIRRGAARALGVIGHVEAVPPLARALDQRDPNLRLEATEALIRIGPAAVSQLLRGLQGSSAEERRLAGEALHVLGWSPTCAGDQAWFAVARDEWAAVVEAGGAAVEPLVRLLSDRSPRVRASAAAALRALGAAAVPSLEEALRDPELRVWSYAARLIGELGGRESLPLLRARLHQTGGRSGSPGASTLKAAIAQIEARGHAAHGLPRTAEMPGATGERLPRDPDGVAVISSGDGR